MRRRLCRQQATMLGGSNGQYNEVEKMPGNAVSRVAAGLCLAARTPNAYRVRQSAVGNRLTPTMLPPQPVVEQALAISSLQRKPTEQVHV